MIVYTRSLTAVSGNGRSVAFECFGSVYAATNYWGLFMVLFFSFHFTDCLLFLKRGALGVKFSSNKNQQKISRLIPSYEREVFVIIIYTLIIVIASIIVIIVA